MNSLLKRMFSTTDALSPTILRVVLGAVMLPHGLQKTIGMFGGKGFTSTMEVFTGPLGLPALVAFLVIMAESVGAVALIVGFLTRFCAASLAIVMLGAIQMAHFQYGFFMNWFGNQAGEGFEYHVLVVGMCVALVISGAGRWSVDRALTK